ncbi:hypothetical protein AUR04nite_16820 [Glutamicibacter uratoxydans]|uniref:Integral membrane bound transporter domain-containing protein n=1 Tax=Glutamicibacter uratoxydans TaxID=43667 RepID=A0A4Y4DRJ0_GLUUR|nr:FUSC family protein [Glutamicibacter uratoxydans]GED06150.1 hypothetical protein AUR04nite_16820 [Glutamicibacter uratoxydans]
MPSPSAPPQLARLVLLSAAAVCVGLLPVGLAAWLFDAQIAQGVYIGLVLMTSVVRTLNPREQWLAAGFSALVAAAGSFIGPQLGWLLLAVPVVCAVQGWFSLHSTQAVAVLPAILLLDAMGGRQQQWLAMGIATFVGAVFLILAARLAKISAEPKPLAAAPALLHACLLAAGCLLLVLLGHWLGVERGHWALLAFCLMFTPALVTGQQRSAFGYIAAVMMGTVLAAAVGLLNVEVLTVAFLVIGALGTVAGTLAARPILSASALTLAVILLNSMASGESVGAIGGQRAGLALLSLAVVLSLLWIGRWAGANFSLFNPEPAGGQTGARE